MSDLESIYSIYLKFLVTVVLSLAPSVSALFRKKSTSSFSAEPFSTVSGNFEIDFILTCLSS